jgi:hypothetical protein
MHTSAEVLCLAPSCWSVKHKNHAHMQELLSGTQWSLPALCWPSKWGHSPSFFHRTFASSCWQLLGITWSATSDLHDKIARTRNSLNLPFFMEIFIIATWEIGNQRNRLVFDGQAASPQLWTVKFKDQILLQAHRVVEESRPVIFQWLESTL